MDTASNDSNEAQYPRMPLHRNNRSISRLRDTMTAIEKVRPERVASLERQVELALEMSSRSKSIHQGDYDLASRSGHPGKYYDQRGYPHGDSLEISAMRELLSRVLAEKNRLEIHNENLKELLIVRDESDANVKRLPSSIDKLDSLLDEVHKKDEHCRATELGDRERRKDSPDERRQNSMLYRMTCRSQSEDGPRIK